MALFGKKIEKEEKGESKKAQSATKVPKVAKAVLAPKPVRTSFVSVDTSVILRPHITEKSGILSQSGIYTFQVSETSNKQTIGRAIISMYKVTPVKIAITNLPDRNTFIRGKRGTVAGVRKAIVTVKKGDKIEFV